jgi:oligopeptide/dipeptide ABC transporter ATP-binding protein
VGRQIAEALVVHREMGKKEAWSEAVGLLTRVGIPSPASRARDYPHQLSGGMRQRAMIAMAMACRPELLIADEPTTALDVTIQAQILDLIQELKDELGMAVLLITHNFGIIAETAVRTAVMYAGQVVEEAETADIFDSPSHPYTQGLLHSLPRIGDKIRRGRDKLHEIPGIVPRLTGRKAGCSFGPRCARRSQACALNRPEIVDLGGGHRVRCFPQRFGSVGAGP